MFVKTHLKVLKLLLYISLELDLSRTSCQSIRVCWEFACVLCHSCHSLKTHFGRCPFWQRTMSLWHSRLPASLLAAHFAVPRWDPHLEIMLHLLVAVQTREIGSLFRFIASRCTPPPPPPLPPAWLSCAAALDEGIGSNHGNKHVSLFYSSVLAQSERTQTQPLFVNV